MSALSVSLPLLPLSPDLSEGLSSPPLSEMPLARARGPVVLVLSSSSPVPGHTPPWHGDPLLPGFPSPAGCSFSSPQAPNGGKSKADFKPPLAHTHTREKSHWRASLSALALWPGPYPDSRLKRTVKTSIWGPVGFSDFRLSTAKPIVVPLPHHPAPPLHPSPERTKSSFLPGQTLRGLSLTLSSTPSSHRPHCVGTHETSPCTSCSPFLECSPPHPHLYLHSLFPPPPSMYFLLRRLSLSLTLYV